MVLGEESKEDGRSKMALSAQSWLELTKGSIDLDFSGHKVWYDQGNKQLVLMKKNVYYTLELELGSGLSPPLNFVQAGKTLDVKFSLCKRYLAIQRSDTSIDIVDLVQATEVKLACKSKRGNLILRGGVLWLRRDACKVDVDQEPQNCLCLVTRFGLEIFRLPIAERGESSCKNLGSIKHNIQCFWHLPEHHVLILASGNGAEMRPYQFQGNPVPTKLGKFYLPKIPLSKNILIAKLYDSIYCMEVDLEGRQLNLHKLGRESTTLSKSLQLFTSGSFGISVVDNLICVHNMDGKFTCMYDIIAETDSPCTIPKAMHRAWFNNLEPDSAGLEDGNQIVVEGAIAHSDNLNNIFEESAEGSIFLCVLKIPKFGLPKGSALTHVGGVCVEGLSFDLVLEQLAFVQDVSKQLTFDISRVSGSTSATVPLNPPPPPSEDDPVLYAQSWVFLEPNWILDAKRGHIWKIELNLDSIPTLARLSVPDDSNTEMVEPSFVLSDPRRLYQFLLRRACPQPHSSTTKALVGRSRKDSKAYAKSILLKYLRNLIVCNPNLDKSGASVAYTTINDAYLKALRERASAPTSGGGGANSNSSTAMNSSGANGGMIASSPTSAKTSTFSAFSGYTTSLNLGPFVLGVPSQASIAGADAATSPRSVASTTLNRSASLESLRKSLRAEASQKDTNDDNHSQIMDSLSSPTSANSSASQPRRSNLQQLLDDFRNAGQIALKDIRCYNGMAVVLQIDLFTWVFVPLIPDFAEVSAEDFQTTCATLAKFLSEYIRSLQHHFIPIEKYMHELLAWLLITCRQERNLQQLLQYHVPTDSRRLARTLLETSVKFEPFFQISLDMFSRLGCFDSVSRALLDKDELLPVLCLLQRHPHFLASEHTQKIVEPASSRSQAQGSNSGTARHPPGTVKIRPSELWCCALRVYETHDLDASVFASLHSFFLNCDPWAITPEKATSAGSSEKLDSPLAKEVKDLLGGLDVFPEAIFTKHPHILEAFGFNLIDVKV